MGWRVFGFFFQPDEAAVIVKAGYAKPGGILGLERRMVASAFAF